MNTQPRSGVGRGCLLLGANAMIQFSQSRWDDVRRDAALWWAGQLDRPLVQIRLSGADSGRPAPTIGPTGFRTPYNLSFSAEQIVDRWDHDLSSTRYLGDAFPVVWPNFGPGVLATALGGLAEPDDNTTWFHPAHKLPIDQIRFTYDPAAQWMQRLRSLHTTAAARWGNDVLVAMTDLGGNLDVLSTFRPSEELLLDLYDHPEQVKRLTWEAHEAWWAAFDDMNAARGDSRGFGAWAPIYSDTSYYMLQCDFCYMIGTDMFDEFVRPELAASCKRLGNAFYHLDGPGELPHLDSLLAIPELKGVQWIPGEGQKPMCEWPEVYRNIRAAGKLIQVYDDLDLTQTTRIAEQLGSARGIVALASGDVRHQGRAEAALARFGVPSRHGETAGS